jgi:hypothetical protein
MAVDAALTATPAGKRTFERLGFSPTGYKELFVVNAAEGPLVELEGKGNQEVEMICLYPGDEAVRGTSERVVDGGNVVSASEMVVKYND